MGHCAYGTDRRVGRAETVPPDVLGLGAFYLFEFQERQGARLPGG